MGVEELDGMDKPDVVGGRPPKEEKEEENEREVYGEPVTSSDGEDYWEEVWEKFYSEDRPIHEVIEECCEWASCLPYGVLNAVYEYDIYDPTQHFEEFPTWKEYMSYQLDQPVGGYSSSSSMSSSGDSSDWLSGLQDDEDDSEEEPDASGLKGMLQDNMGS